MTMSGDFFGGSLNPFMDFLEEQQRPAYFAYQDQWRTPNQKKYYQNQFSEIQDQYLGKLGQQVMGGGLPTMKFADFLKGFDWQQDYGGLTPQQRPQGGGGQLTPTARWVV